MYDSQARSRLQDKLDYELWLLEELEEEHEVFPEEIGDTILRKGAAIAQEPGSVTTLSQPRVDQVIERLYPLIFTASYKTIDMIVEWIIEENSGTLNHRWGYAEKNSTISEQYTKGRLQLPPPLDPHPDVFERFLKIYDEVMDHRHAVIHRNEFQINNANFVVESESGVVYSFDKTQLFSFAKAGTTLARLLLDNNIDDEKERSLKRFLDNLSFVHDEGNYEIAPPWAGSLVYHAEIIESEPRQWLIDLDQVREVEESTGSEGYYLKIIGEKCGEEICRWSIPCEEVPDSSSIVLSEEGEDFDEYRI